MNERSGYMTAQAKALRCAAALVCVAVAAAAGGTAGASPGDRTLSGTVALDWGPSAPLPVLAMRVKACVTDGTAATCFADSNGWTPATRVGDTSSYDYAIALDSSQPYAVLANAVVDFAAPGQPISNPRILSFGLGAQFVQTVAAGTEPADRDFTLDTAYYRLSGQVAYSGADQTHGVGACPAGQPLIGTACNGLAFSWARTDGTYELNLLPGDWRASGFVLDGGTGGGLRLGILNLLPLASPPSAGTWQQPLDFNADVLSTSREVEMAGPNGGDGNYDLVPDVDQTDVSTLLADDGSYVTIDGTFGVDDLDVSVAVSQPLTALLDAPPPDTAFPSGIGMFTVGPMPVGQTAATVRLIFHTPPPAGFEFWKYVGGAWGPYPVTEVTPPAPGAYAIDVTLIDGQPGDYDGQANGYLTDPFALVVPDPYQVSPLAITVSGPQATVRWTATIDGDPVSEMPGGTTLTAKCKGPGRKDLPFENSGPGAFVATFSGSDKQTCVVQLGYPATSSPSATILEQTAPARFR